MFVISCVRAFEDVDSRESFHIVNTTSADLVMRLWLGCWSLRRSGDRRVLVVREGKAENQSQVRLTSLLRIGC